MVSTFVRIPGYRITEELYNGSRTLVYRGDRETDSLAIVIKLLKNPYPSFSELLSFRNQYTIAKNLNSPLIVQTYSLEPYQNGYALVMEDFGGISLKEWKFRGNLQSLQEFLNIALALCDTLNLLYKERIIHKDIKPSNILINPETKQIKLIDFSIASLLPRETQTLVNPNVLEGTLAYISPEQTGRMNRGIDYRTDFYSLGITFYELLTGELPFASNEPMELVHSHIAKLPEQLTSKTKKEIPQVLGDIVMKLMAKNAEERYQSALGLKFDLEKCLEQLQATGSIHKFEIATRDVCDRFIIPDKLYGRETEVQALLKAFDRVSQGSSELMLVAGFSGIGKTAAVNEVHKPITQQKGYFIKGKFDQFNRNIPLSAFVQALRELMNQLLSESDRQLQTWKEKLLKALGDSGQVLIDLIPELERIIGSQPPTPELSGEAAQNRFNRLFQNFIQVFAKVEHPLVIFIDDLQWADSASLDLMQSLLTQAQSHSQCLLVLGAYRDNEVFPGHPFLMTVKALEDADVTLETLTLSPLSAESLNHLIADAFQASQSAVQPLTNLVMQKTQGNPFFATQFLKALYQDSLITFDREVCHWQCDLVQVQDAALTDDVVEFMALQLRKLPVTTQEQLKFAACIGAKFDLKTLTIVSEQDEIQVALTLWSALQEGLIVPESKIYKFYLDDNQPQEHRSLSEEISEQIHYRFFHDRVQQAAYSLIPEDQKQATHLKMGKLLQTRLSAAEREEKLFDIVSHLNLSRGLLSHQAERESLIRLNLAAIEKAKKATAYGAARDLVTVGLELLSEDSWETQYELSLKLHEIAADVACLKADFEEAIAQVQQVLDKAQTVLDKVPVYMVQIRVLTAQNQLADAIAIAAQAITQLGIEFPSDITPSLSEQTLQNVEVELEGKVIEDLVNLPAMTDPTTIAAMELLGTIVPMVFLAKPAFLPFVCAKTVSLSLQFGNAPVSSVGYSTYSLVLATGLGQLERGYRFGKMALTLIDQLNAKAYKCLTILNFAACVQHQKESMISMAALAKQGYLAGIEVGDFLYLGYCITHYFYAYFYAGKELSALQSEVAQFCSVIASLKQDNALTYLTMSQEFFGRLLEKNHQPTLLIGDAYDETKIFPQYLQNKQLTGLGSAYTYKLILAYLFGDYNRALEYLNEVNRYLGNIVGFLHIPAVHFYGGLTYLAVVAGKSEDEQLQLLALAEQHHTNLSTWAENAPMNHQHKVVLLAAERCRVLGNISEAIDGYERAIAGAKANGYTNEEALANELAAKFYLDWGKEKVAASYMQEAYYCYARWGAKAKVADLERRYPQLLAPILQQSRSLLSTHETIFTLGTVTSTTSSSSSSSISDILDLKTVLKASQTLSGEIELEKLMSSLLSIVIENAGADKCVLMLLREERLLIKGSIIQGTQPLVLQSIPVEESQDIPHKLIYKVLHNNQTVVLVDATAEIALVNDPYIIRQQPQSVLCSPILHQGKLMGILYLENKLAKGAFSGDRVELLNLLCAQAAISLENAQLYERSLEYSQQLEIALHNLQQAQLQMIQSEKMSALGNLVAGVAHEMNNPLGFIAASLKQAKPTFTDIVDHLKLYQQTLPDKSEEIEDHESEIDLEYSLSDLPKMLDSMTMACDRLKNISTSLRTFSRADRDYKVPFNIHEGIDSTILILKHRLKANEQRPAIEVVTNYGNLPQIECFPGQLNQVFMNIFANAIDAIEESSIGRSFEDIQANSNRITISTYITDNLIKIAIADNGKGMSEAVQSKIFDHLFTTKAVGKGTGLGLAIARQIVESTHGGKLSCNSVLGEGTEFVIEFPV
ncbi:MULTISPECIES: ATP-binding sensor histidine kinase [unclassified Nostoc]|uniref:trifunctional serine/threonine-protein kinase/ATP-binding protein/sensor histidine kinase n=1 Tax=unclassified Nostoc TaxID=2593658 RepID=UPI002AD244D4|nr:ATP-binding sensor histidine kinase [Nostoc sp. DedQUE03]MDZ7974293.1 ATP-binding sensor histidine kinase [Nostoc sp. DedQUE03]MDZ8043588.1 ATP-binding sensor histidine kinase [Nostoc sp. DedQUE02]